jgi:DNA-binding FadR family transcriptional regulator
MPPIARSSVADLVFAELRDAILMGRYEPGDRLPPQRELARELSVNMVSVREALKRLEQLRLVEVRHGDATRVLDWRTSGGLEALASLGAMDQAIASDLFEARRLLLTEAARLAADRRTDEQAARLAELAEAVANARDDEMALVADWAFMATLVDASGNLVFKLIMNSVRAVYLPSADSFVGMLGDPDLYLEVARAVEAGDANSAADATALLAAEQEHQLFGPNADER